MTTTSYFPVEPRLAARSGTARGKLVTSSASRRRTPFFVVVPANSITCQERPPKCLEYCNIRFRPAGITPLDPPLGLCPRTPPGPRRPLDPGLDKGNTGWKPLLSDLLPTVVDRYEDSIFIFKKKKSPSAYQVHFIQNHDCACNISNDEANLDSILDVFLFKRKFKSLNDSNWKQNNLEYMYFECTATFQLAFNIVIKARDSFDEYL